PFCPSLSCSFSCKYELPNLQILCFDNDADCGWVGVCVATEAVAAGAGELHGSFAYLPGRRPLEFGFAPCRAFSAWRQLPHPHQVEGDGGEGELCGYFSKPAHPESPHPSLLFQDAEDRLDHRFSSSVQRSPGGGIQLFSESPMRRVIRV